MGPPITPELQVWMSLQALLLVVTLVLLIYNKVKKTNDK